MADTDHVAGPGDDEEERLLRLGSYVVADGLLRLLAWLAPVIVLVVLGLVISSAASTETTGPFGETTTEFNDRGMWTALLCFSLAALCFFGRGTLKSLASALRGGAVDVVFLPSTVWSLLLAVAAALVAVFSLFMALIGAS